MTVHIEPARILFFLAGLVICYFVFKYSKRGTLGLPTAHGDLVGAIGSGCVVVMALLALFLPEGKETPPPSSAPSAVPTSVPAPPQGVPAAGAPAPSAPHASPATGQVPAPMPSGQ